MEGRAPAEPRAYQPMRLTDPSNMSPTPTMGLGSNIKGQALRVSSQVLSTPSCQVSNNHHHPAPWPSWFHSVLLQATPSLCGTKEKGRRHRQAPIISQAGPVLPCRHLEDVHLSVYARTHTRTLCTQTSINSKSIHNQKCTHIQWMNSQTHNNRRTRAFINTQVTYNRHMKRTRPCTAAHGHCLVYTHRSSPRDKPLSLPPGTQGNCCQKYAPHSSGQAGSFVSAAERGQVMRSPQQLGGQAR